MDFKDNNVILHVKPPNLKTMQILHLILLAAVYSLFLLYKISSDENDYWLKTVGVSTAFLASIWTVVLFIYKLILNQSAYEKFNFISFYKNLLTKPFFLVTSNLLFLISFTLLLTLLTLYRQIEFRTSTNPVEVYLNKESISLNQLNSQSLGVVTPDKPLVVRLWIGKRRISYEDVSLRRKKSAEIIDIKPVWEENSIVHIIE